MMEQPRICDCEDMLQYKHKRAVINDGEVVKFINEDEEE